MGLCAFCKDRQAQFYEYGVPICPDCRSIGETVPDHKTDIYFALLQDLAEAKVRAEAALIEFKSLIANLPSGLHPPDGAQHIQDVSHELTAARKKMGRASDRLEDYLNRRIGPEDLNLR